jgi:hypothetical protein
MTVVGMRMMLVLRLYAAQANLERHELANDYRMIRGLVLPGNVGDQTATNNENWRFV